MNARLQHPIGCHYNSADRRLYVADSYNHKIKKIAVDAYEKYEFEVKNWVGVGKPGLEDGPKGSLNEPNGLWPYYAKGEYKGLLVADTGNNCVRIVRPNDHIETLELKGIPEVQFTVNECKDGVCEADFS